MIKNKLFMRILLLLLIVLALQNLAIAQADSVETTRLDSSSVVQQDSILLAQQKNTSKLLNDADSIHRVDSIQQLLILEQITNLKASDENRKVALQIRLDSLKTLQTQRTFAIKKKVDSLRTSTVGVPVTVYGDTVFYVFAKLGPFSPSERAQSITQKIEMLVDQSIFDQKEITFFDNEESCDVFHSEIILFSVTERDAFWLDESKREIAEKHSKLIVEAVREYHIETGMTRLLIRVGLLVFVLFLFYLGIRLLNRGFVKLNDWLIIKFKPFTKGIKFKNYEFLSQAREEQVIRWVLKVIKWMVIMLLVYLSLPTVFSIFPSTKGFATKLFGYILDPVINFGVELIGYIPELITIIVIISITRYFVRFLNFLALEIEKGKLQLPGFFPDWSTPTFNLLRIVIYAFSFILIFPYLPGSDSAVFQGVSVFLGILISLGSSSAISNIIAGLVITYMRAFKIGDRVKIADTTGDVIEKTMLVTRVRTIKNEDVTIPNSSILNGNTVNYSSSAETLGLILNTTITIGYDVPWRKVHELLIDAAVGCEYVMKEPKPFVLQTSLDDFYVSYQINAYTATAGVAAKVYSELHSKIQDNFNEAGIEILSPHYRAARDGNMVTTPAEYLPKDYQVPKFNVNINKENNS